ncbi:MAG: ABC transporter substrate-binding protein [Spirochaetales bacterium]|nr:ABC transporter substrate-binding protein [Spirochaetales bacterium]
MSMIKKNRYYNKNGKVRIIIFVILIMSWFFLMCCSKPKIYRVGVLSGVNFVAEITDGFKARMTELGYIEGRNISYDVQRTDFDMEVYDRILKKLVENKVDLILVFPTEASQVAKTVAEGTGIPVVFANAFTEDTGLVNSVQEPGGNITGVRWPGPEIVARGFDILMELVPHTKRMFVPYQRNYISRVKCQLDALRPAAASANITLVEIPASSPEELENELMKQKGPFDSVVIHTLAEPLAITPGGFAALVKFAAGYKIPIGGIPIFEGGYQAIFGIIPPPIAQGRQAAYLADKIFNGTPAGTLPVITAEYHFTLNYMQAEKLGLTVSERLLSQADNVIR